LAFATVGLGVAIVGLSLGLAREASAGQSRDMQGSMAIANRSAHATEEATKAANLNAKAAIGGELPIIWIAELELRRGPGIAGQIVGGDVPAEITPVLDFKNRGRTAAELRAPSVLKLPRRAPSYPCLQVQMQISVCSRRLYGSWHDTPNQKWKIPDQTAPR